MDAKVKKAKPKAKTTLIQLRLKDDIIKIIDEIRARDDSQRAPVVRRILMENLNNYQNPATLYPANTN